MPRIEETQLPGVGLRHEFTTRTGDRLGVISHRTGRRELLIYDRADPDSCRDVVRLDEDEGHALAEVLGGSSVAEHLGAMVQQSVEGLTIDWLPVDASSQSAGRTVAETDLRARTGVTIVAVVRGRDTEAAPAADFRIEAGDTLVVVGTLDGVKEAFAWLQGQGER